MTLWFTILMHPTKNLKPGHELAYACGRCLRTLSKLVKKSKEMSYRVSMLFEATHAFGPAVLFNPDVNPECNVATSSLFRAPTDRML